MGSSGIDQVFNEKPYLAKGPYLSLKVKTKEEKG